MREEPGAGRGPIGRVAVRGASPATGEGRGMAIIVTGCAGFIGFHVSLALLERGEQVIGVDDLNAYYDPALKRARLERLEQRPGFAFARLDVADRDGITDLAHRHRDAVTGGVHLAAQEGGEQWTGLDALNAYHEPALTRARRERLAQRPGFAFARLDVADRDGITDLAHRHRDAVTGVVHLAAQAGVRHSLKAPFDYVHSNLEGHMAILEACRHELPKLGHLVYASSSSVYGGNTKIPFAVEDRVDQPISLYAATKRANELMSH